MLRRLCLQLSAIFKQHPPQFTPFFFSGKIFYYHRSGNFFVVTKKHFFWHWHVPVCVFWNDRLKGYFVEDQFCEKPIDAQPGRPVVEKASDSGWRTKQSKCFMASTSLKSPKSISRFYLSRVVKHHVYVKWQTRICTTWPSFLFTCRFKLFLISTPKLVVSLDFLSIRIFLAVFICSFSILRNSQLESDVCRLPYT